METPRSTVMIVDRPVEQAPRTPFPPPSGPPYHPPFDFHLPPAPPAPKRRRGPAMIVAVAALLAGAGVAVGIEGRHDSGPVAAPTTVPHTPASSVPTTVPSAGSPNGTGAPAVTQPAGAHPVEPLPTASSSPAVSDKTLNPDAINQLVDPAVVDINTTLDGGRAAGTGIVLTPSGLVLTNNHVIDGATEISAQISGTGATYAAHVVGYSVVDDVALIQLENASNLATVTVGDSDGVKVGDTIVTIGNALGAPGPHAVTSGSVIDLNQTITANDFTGDSESLSGLIEFDATIQPGDSGGPLVDAHGRIVGINTAATVDGRRQMTSSAGYAIPINHALEIARAIQAGDGSATVHIGDRAILGITITRNDPTTDGVVVASVNGGSPADQAGMQRGSTITGIDDATINTVEDLERSLFRKRPGDRVQLKWLDVNGQQQSAEVSLIAGPPA